MMKTPGNEHLRMTASSPGVARPALSPDLSLHAGSLVRPQVPRAAVPAAMLLVTAALRVRLATPAADSHLRRGRPIGHYAGRLVIADGNLRRQLTGAVRHAVQGACAPLVPSVIEWREAEPIGCGRFWVTALSAPVGGPVERLAAVFIESKACADVHPADVFAAVHRLSRTEHRLLRLLVDGHDLKSAATRLGQQLSTTRTVLKKIFLKTDTHRQAELIAVALRDD